jgi:hypothetical protein
VQGKYNLAHCESLFAQPHPKYNRALNSLSRIAARRWTYVPSDVLVAGTGRYGAHFCFAATRVFRCTGPLGASASSDVSPAWMDAKPIAISGARRVRDFSVVDEARAAANLRDSALLLGFRVATPPLFELIVLIVKIPWINSFKLRQAVRATLSPVQNAQDFQVSMAHSVRN